MEVTPTGQVQLVVPAVLNVTVSAKAEGAVSAVSAARAVNARLKEAEARDSCFLGFMGFVWFEILRFGLPIHGFQATQENF